MIEGFRNPLKATIQKEEGHFPLLFDPLKFSFELGDPGFQLSKGQIAGLAFHLKAQGGVGDCFQGAAEAGDEKHPTLVCIEKMAQMLFKLGQKAVRQQLGMPVILACQGQLGGQREDIHLGHGQIFFQYLGGKFQGFLPIGLLHVIYFIEHEKELVDVFPDILEKFLLRRG